MLQLLNREDCHLCEVAQRELDRLGVPYETVDVDSDPVLEGAYGECVPVILYGGAEIARAPIDAVALRKAVGRLKLEAR